MVEFGQLYGMLQMNFCGGIKIGDGSSDLGHMAVKFDKIVFLKRSGCICRPASLCSKYKRFWDLYNFPFPDYSGHWKS